MCSGSIGVHKCCSPEKNDRTNESHIPSADSCPAASCWSSEHIEMRTELPNSTMKGMPPSNAVFSVSAILGLGLNPNSACVATRIASQS